jgi:predicted alpha/beta superfamily hydrolase
MFTSSKLSFFRNSQRAGTLAVSIACLTTLLPVPQSSAGEPSTTAAAAQRTSYALANTKVRSLKSKAGREYRIMISWPEGKAPEAGFPVCYVLDGDDLFAPMTGILRIQAGTEKASKHNAITPGIIVAIGYPGQSGRAIDYTPAAPKAAPETYLDGRPYRDQESGGAAEFFAFLQSELKPVIEKEYAVDTKRQTLLGAGYGGLFALHVLFTHPDAFASYVAVSPSIWWNGRYILQEEKAFSERASGKPVNARLLLTVGDLEQSLTEHEYSWPDAQRDEHALKVSRRRMVDNTREMYWRLQKLAPAGLQVGYHVFLGESHKSVVPMALSRALPFIFPPQTETE